MKEQQSTLTSKLGIAALIVAIILGLWIAGTAFFGGDEAPECPPGTTWSEAHQHCH